MLQHGIYTITENGQSRNYIAQNAGSLLSAAKLLHTLETVKRNLPKGSRTSVLEALDKDYNFVALKGKSYNLLHALDDREFAEAVKKIEDGESQDAHIEVDFDTGSLGLLSDNHGEAARLTLPITAIVDAYSGSLRQKNSNQSYVNTNNFAKQIEKTCDTQLELSPQKEAYGELSQGQKLSL